MSCSNKRKTTESTVHQQIIRNVFAFVTYLYIHNLISEKALNEDADQPDQPILCVAVLEILTACDTRTDEKIYVFLV